MMSRPERSFEFSFATYPRMSAFLASSRTCSAVSRKASRIEVGLRVFSIVSCPFASAPISILFSDHSPVWQKLQPAFMTFMAAETARTCLASMNPPSTTACSSGVNGLLSSAFTFSTINLRRPWRIAAPACAGPPGRISAEDLRGGSAARNECSTCGEAPAACPAASG